MNHDYYALNDDHTVRPSSMEEWSRRFETNRRVALDTVNEYQISTVFLGLNHSFDDGPPLLFETMVFKGESYADLICERCSTWDEATAQHARIVEQVRKDPP